jgi:asparagine synthetase B (glutamine-hydrolysing)
MRQTDLEIPFTDTRLSNVGRVCLYGILNSAWCSHSFEMGDREDMRVGVETRNPFLDRRIAELALALPRTQRQRGKLTKYVLRQAMQGLLPESVRNRLDKADFMHFFADASRLLGDDFSPNFAPIQAGWVNRAEIKKFHRDLLACYAEGGSRKPVGAWGLWMTYGIGLWWEAAFSQKTVSLSESINRELSLVNRLN